MSDVWVVVAGYHEDRWPTIVASTPEAAVLAVWKDYRTKPWEWGFEMDDDGRMGTLYAQDMTRDPDDAETYESWLFLRKPLTLPGDTDD